MCWWKQLQIALVILSFGFSGGKNTSCTRPSNLIGAYGDFGEWNLTIHTSNDQVQTLFNQGLLLIFGFNQVEARENLKAALALDENCIMCYWGLALASSPNLNTYLNIHTHDLALNALTRATERCDDTVSYECQLVHALRNRFPSKDQVEGWRLMEKDGISFSLESMQPFAEQYAAVMEQLYTQYPSDTTIASLYAEAQLSCSPWKYYSKQTTELLPVGEKAWKALEKVLKIEHHPFALHLWIHLTEQSDLHKYLAEEAAFWIQRVVPASCHLVHMASHIYQRTGRYASAILVNYKALDIHNHYYSQCLEPYGVYHDPATIVEPALASGRSQIALHHSLPFNSPVTLEVVRMNAGAYPRPDLIVYSRFGMWTEILQTKNELKETEFLTVYWLYSQALAHAATGQHETAIKMAAKLQGLCNDKAFEANQNTKCKIASFTVSARLAIDLENNMDKALSFLKAAVQLEDAEQFNEPRLWYLPLRQCLGAVYLAANNVSAALDSFQRDLIQNPHNVWSLHGQHEAVKRLRLPERLVMKAKQELEVAMQSIDVPIASACVELF